MESQPHSEPEGVSRETEHSPRHIIAVVNQKGGVGKTTTAINLAACLAQSGLQILLVDMDPQGNCTTGLGLHKRSLTTTIYHALMDGSNTHSAILPTSVPGLSVIPSNIDLAGAEVELVGEIARETRLKTAIQPLIPCYDYIILDAPPSLGLLTVNCLAAADSIIIPIQCEYYALEGLAHLTTTLRLVMRHLNPSLTLMGILLTMHDARTRLSSQVADQVRQHFQDSVFDSVIPRSVRLSEAPSHGLPITAYDPASRGALAYNQLAKEVMQRG